MVSTSLAKQTEEFFEDLTSDEAKKAALRTTGVRARAREELDEDEFKKLNNLPSPSNPNESAAFERLYLSVGNDAKELEEANTRYRDESKAQLQNFLISSSPELTDLSVKQKNLLATQRSGEEKNRVRATAFKTFVDLGIEPRKAETLAATVDWTPILGDVSGFEDAIVSYKNGNMGWAAFETTLGIIGLAPIVGDVIRKGFKTIGGKPNLDFEVVTPEGVSISIPKEDLIGTKNEMFAGESSELAKSRKGPFNVEKDKLNLTSLEDVGVDVSAIKPRVLEGLDSSKQMWKDFKIQLKKEDNIDLNTFKGAGSGSSGNIIADIKSMDNLTKTKVKAKLNEMWVKTGWTVGSKNKFFTEIDDSNIIRNADKSFDFNKFSENQSEFKGFYKSPEIKLEEVLDHPELYEAYPELKGLTVRFDDGAEKSYSAYYTSNKPTDAPPFEQSEIVMSKRYNKIENLTNKNLTDIESGRRDFVSTLLHEIQHAIQHIEFQNAGATWAWQKDNSKRLLNNIDTAVEDIDEMLLDPLSPKRKESLIAKKLDLQFKSDKIKSMDLKNNPKSGIDSYYKTQKEVEARNVQERAFYDMNERYNKSPYDTLTTYAKGINGEEIIRRAATDNYGVLDKQKYRNLMDKFREVSNIEGYNKATTYSLLYKKRPYAEYQVNSPAYSEVKIGGVSIKGITELYSVPSIASNRPKLDYDTTYKALKSGHNLISDLLRQETAKLTTVPKTIKTIGGAEINIKNIKTDDAYYNTILNNIDAQANTRKFPMEIEETVDYDRDVLRPSYEFPEVTERTVGQQKDFTVATSASLTEPVLPLEIGVNKTSVEGKFLKSYTNKDEESLKKLSKNSTAGTQKANKLINTPVEVGKKVGIRLNLNSNIPNAPEGRNKLQTIHANNYNGEALSYMSSATVENVTFNVSQKGRASIASKKFAPNTPEAKSKYNAMSVDGNFNPNRSVLNEMNEDVVEINFNPMNLHLFINTATGQAVKSADVATVIGDRIFAKGVKYMKKAEAPTPINASDGTKLPSEVRYAYKKGGLMSRSNKQ